MDQDNHYYDMDSLQTRANGADSARREARVKRGAFFKGLAVGATGALLLVCIALLVQLAIPKEGSSSPLEIGASEGSKQESGDFLTRERMDKLEALRDVIREEYYLEEKTDEEMWDGIYKGLFQSLGDPYSEYYTAQEFTDLMESSSGVYYGIGAYLSLDAVSSLPKVASVISGAPAEEVGLRPNDLIYKVDGVSLQGLTLTESVKLIKGMENTQVVLTIIRDGDQFDVPVTRRQVESPTVKSEMLEDGMGYLQITEFDDVTTNQFLKALNELKQQNMKGMILDLRANPGGNLSTVVQIAQNILPEGVIVSTKDKAGREMVYRSKGDKELQLPLVVLIDMNSASASEILAGAIQDHKKGTLVGTTSFGKGIVQSVQPLNDGTAFKITISSYFTPGGRNIHGTGIEPDIVCEFDGSLYYDVEEPIDTQLEKAKEVLAEMMK